jgi:hypothetical protein
MRKKTFIKFIAGASLISLIACQKIKKEEQKSYSDWQPTDVSELEKKAETKVSTLMSCRLRPVENYHLYYTVYVPEKTSAKEEKVDKLTVKFYDDAYLGNYIHSYNADKSSATSTKLSTKKVKALIKKDELLNILEVYEQDSTVLTRAEEEEALKKQKAQEEAAAAAAKKAEADKKQDKDNEVVAKDSDKDNEKEKPVVKKANSESTEVSKDENLNAIDKFTKGYKLVLKLQKHSVTGEAKNLSESLPFNSILSDKESLKGVTLECQ